MYLHTRTRPLVALVARLAARWRGGADGGIVRSMPRATTGLPVYWTPSRAAEELGVHRQTIHDWMAAGRLAPVAVARETRERIVYLFDPDDVRRVAAEIAS